MAAFFINTGKTGKWRKEFHSAIFPVTIGKKAANRLYMKLTRDSRRFSVFFVKIYCLKDRKFLATKILVLATKPKKVFPWNLSPVVQRGASISCAETIFTQSSQRQFCRAKIFLKMKSITDSYLFSFLAMRRSLPIRAFTRAFGWKIVGKHFSSMTSFLCFQPQAQIGIELWNSRLWNARCTHTHFRIFLAWIFHPDVAVRATSLAIFFSF